MNGAWAKISHKRDAPAGAPISLCAYGKLMDNGTIFLSFGTPERDIEITCTRAWAEDLLKKVQYALSEQNEREPGIPVQALLASQPQAAPAKT